MGDNVKKLLQLLKEDSTVNCIKKELGLTNASLAYSLSILKNCGYVILPKYYGNGSIRLSLSNVPIYLEKYVNLYTASNEDKIRFLVISDLHYFNTYENRSAIYNAFNYCAKNNIHTIFVCGDLIDCMENNKVPIEKQALEFTKLYPYDDHIISFCVLGNHDAMSLKKTNIDMKKIIENRRLDIVPINYLEAKVCIKNDALILRHPVNKKSHYSPDNNNYLNFIGHSHRTKITERMVYVPTLSNVKINNGNNFSHLAQAMDATIKFNSENRSFDSIVIDQLVMEDVAYITGEYIIGLSRKKFDNNNIEVDSYPDEKVLVKK